MVMRAKIEHAVVRVLLWNRVCHATKALLLKPTTLAYSPFLMGADGTQVVGFRSKGLFLKANPAAAAAAALAMFPG